MPIYLIEINKGKNLMIANIIVIVTTLIITSILFAKPIEKSAWWSATVIPLASIIGSGFLVIAPILQMNVGRYALVSMLGLVVMAYLIGGAIRFNIRYVEPKLEKGTLNLPSNILEQLSQWALSFAYIVSVTYYLSLFGDFVLRGTNTTDTTLSHIITTAILLFIVYFGRHRGFNFLGRFEAVKLGIIIGLVTGLIYGNFTAFQNGLWHLPNHMDYGWHELREVLGMLIVVQGFETSRYLGTKFSPELRIKSMRYAQLISAFIYVIYIALMLYYFKFPLPTSGQDTAIITLSKNIATILPIMLISLALIAQFDAAVADTQGGSGLIEELSKKRISKGFAYIIIATGSILIVWTSNIFEIITYASQAFALYYTLQSIIAALTALQEKSLPYRWVNFFRFCIIASIALSVVFFGIASSA